MLTVHHLNNSRSQRILWLLEELGVDYQVRLYQRDARTMLAPPELKAVHPLGKSPLITDGAITVAESGAIVDYLMDRYAKGRLLPAADSAEQRRYRFWLHYAEGSLMPLLVMKLVVGEVAKRAPWLIRPVARLIVGGINQAFIGPQLALHLGYIENELSQHEWMAGAEFSAADIQMSFPLEAAAARSNASRYPRIQNFLARIHARPAYRLALERGGPFELPG